MTFYCSRCSTFDNKQDIIVCGSPSPISECGEREMCPSSFYQRLRRYKNHPERLKVILQDGITIECLLISSNEFTRKIGKFLVDAGVVKRDTRES